MNGLIRILPAGILLITGLFIRKITDIMVLCYMMSIYRFVNI